MKPTLYHRGKKGAIYQWSIWTEGADIVTEYGQVGGQMQIARKRAEPKNVGRANATTAEEQALSEAQSMWTFKIERKYADSIEKCKQRKVSPMLAPGKDFKEIKKYVTYPCDVQPKLDGNRCLAYWEGDRIVLMSRGGKEWDLDHIKAQLAKILPEDGMLDGELYIHGESCQRMTKLIKSKFLSERERVQLHVYDVPLCDGEERLWKNRRLDLFRLVQNHPDGGLRGTDETPNILLVPTIAVFSEDEVYAMQAKFLEMGFEGAMVRLLEGPYESGYRSKYLLKVKSFDDTEFKIVGFSDGKGKNVGVVKWTCVLEDGVTTFDCAPTGRTEDRKQMFQEGLEHIGKLLKVKHQGRTDEGIPRFPIGIAFRDPMDMSSVV